MAGRWAAAPLLVSTALIAASFPARSLSGGQFHAIPLPPLPTGTATIAGLVKTETGAPASGATLTLREADVERPRHAHREVIADGRGRFTIDGVPASTLTLTAALDGFVESEFGQARPGFPGTPIRLNPRERLNVELTLGAGASLSGLARDPQGVPTSGIGVHAFRLEGLDDTVEILGRGGSATSDANGNWRIDHLPGGTYAVLGYREPPVSVDLPPLVSIGPGQSAVEWGGYFPGTVDADSAQRVDLGDRDHRAGIVIDLALVPVTTVSGVVRDPDGRPVPRARVSLLTRSQLGPLPRATETASDGRFVLTHVRSGDYRLDAFDAHSRLRARTGITADGKTPRHESLTLGAAATVRGRVVLERTRSNTGSDPVAIKPPRINIFLAEAHAGMIDDVIGVPSITTSAAEFSFDAVPPGRYTFSISDEFRLSGDRNWWPRSVMVNGRDVLDDAFEIAGAETISDVVVTLVDAQTELSGVVTGRDGRLHTNGTVVVFPTDEERWPRGWRQVRIVRPDTHGRYLTHDLPAGEYFVALGSPEILRRPPSSVLRTLRGGAKPVVLRHGQSATVNLAVR